MWDEAKHTRFRKAFAGSGITRHTLEHTHGVKVLESGKVSHGRKRLGHIKGGMGSHYATMDDGRQVNRLAHPFGSVTEAATALAHEHGIIDDHDLIGSSHKLRIGPHSDRHTLWTDEHRKQAQDMVDAAIERHPELVSSRQHVQLAGVEMVTGAHLSEDSHAGEVDRAMLVRRRGAHAVAIMSRRGGSHIVLNDELRPPNESDTHLSPASRTVAGVVTHEFGHTFHFSHGVDGQRAGQLLTEHGIRPVDVAGVSTYATSHPHEALAEMYAMKHTPGFSLPPELDRKYSRLEDEVRTKDLAGFSTLVDGAVIGSESDLMPAMAAAAKRNLNANAWVAPAWWPEVQDVTTTSKGD
jgi:hypothetical protein